VVAPYRLTSGRGPCPERIGVAVAVETSGRFVDPAIPDFVNESPHLILAFGNLHHSARWFGGIAPMVPDPPAFRGHLE
jgi:hypothetical protein